MADEAKELIAAVRNAGCSCERSLRAISDLEKLWQEAEHLLDRYREKARLLVMRTKGEYSGGEAIQFLVNDYDRHKRKVAALAASQPAAPADAGEIEPDTDKGYTTEQLGSLTIGNQAQEIERLREALRRIEFGAVNSSPWQIIKEFQGIAHTTLNPPAKDSK